jgi:hypothetical protein
MKTKLTISLILFFCVLSLNAQSFKATYTYDANGNRETATVIYLSLKSAKIDSVEQDSAKMDMKMTLKNEQQLDSISNNFSVRIFPNPTQNDILVEINGVNPSDFTNLGNSIKLLSLNGQLMLDIKPVTSYNTIDLSQFNKGAYLLLLYINGKAKSYKIIKN